jgi:AsmA protein
MATSRLRKISFVFGGLVLLTVAALVWLVASFDPNAYKGLAIDWMKTERHRTLVIDGPIKLSVFPRLTVQLSAVTLSERDRPDTFAHLDDVSLSVAVMPLLRKRLEVDRIAARGLRATYRRAADGTTNIDDLLDKQKPKPAAEGGPKGEALAFDVQSIRFDDLRLTVHDALAKIDGDLAITTFSTGRLADQRESPIELDAQLALTQPALAGRLSGKTLLKLDLKTSSVALRDMQLAWAGDAFGIKALDTKVTGALAYDGAAGTLSADNLDARISAVLGALRLDGSQVAVKAFGYDPLNQQLSLDQLKVRIAGQQDGHPLKLDLDWPTLAVKGNTLSGGPVTGALSLQGPTAIDATFKSAAPKGNFERIVVPAFETTLKGSSGPRRLGGTVRSDLRLDVAGRVLSVDALAARLRIEEPSLQPLALNVNGRATASADAASWKLSGDINTNPFDTDGQVRLADKPMAITASANFKALDLNRLLPAASATTAPAASAPAGGGAGDAAPVDLSALKSMQGRLSLRAGTFAFRQYRAANLALDATLSGGVLRASPFAADLWKGRLDMAVTADAGANRVAAKGAATGIDVAALLKDVADKDLLEGRGRVSFDLDTAGRTVGQMKARLHGQAGLQLQDGAIKGINLAKQLRQARAALSMKADADTRATTTEKTDFSELGASFAITDGIARNSDLSVKSPFLRLGGEGLVDIPKSRIDYTVRATVAETSKGQGGAELAELRGVTIPVQLTGPLDAVAWRIRWSAVAADVLKSQVGKKVEEQLKDKLSERLGLPPRGASAPEGGASRPEDELKRKLRGLFK